VRIIKPKPMRNFPFIVIPKSRARWDLGPAPPLCRADSGGIEQTRIPRIAPIQFATIRAISVTLLSIRDSMTRLGEKGAEPQRPSAGVFPPFEPRRSGRSAERRYSNTSRYAALCRDAATVHGRDARPWLKVAAPLEPCNTVVPTAGSSIVSVCDPENDGGTPPELAGEDTCPATPASVQWFKARIISENSPPPGEGQRERENGSPHGCILVCGMCRYIEAPSLTPALSRWERQNCPRTLEKTEARGSSMSSPAIQRGRLLFPLPVGEGKGEGEPHVQMRRLC
jgi:hypothetical protein